MAQNATSGFQEGFVEIVKEQIRALQQSIKEYDAEIANLERGLTTARDGRLEAAHRVDQLRSLLSNDQSNGSAVPGRVVRRPFADADAVVDLIREHGAPMHYEKIHEVLVNRGFEIGGKGEANTLLSRYFNDHRLTRVSRGTYDLSRRAPAREVRAQRLEHSASSRDSSFESLAVPEGVPLVEKIAFVLSRAGEPLHYREITDRLLSSGAWRTTGKTPEATVNSRLVVEINENGSRSTFIRTAPGVYGLRAWDIVAD